MNLSRRSFLTGTAAAALAPALPAFPAPVRNARALVPYLGRLEIEAQFLEGISQKVAHTMIYGNPDWHPTQFTGLTPFYSPPPEECIEAA